VAEHPLKRFVERIRSDPFFLGSTLTEFQAARGWDERALATFLGCDIVGLYRLASCRAPALKDPVFAQEMRAIAAFGGCDADRLVQLVRETSVSTTLRGTPSDTGNTYLLAARDRKDKEPRKRRKHDPGQDG
jgi:hypothetical protein